MSHTSDLETAFYRPIFPVFRRPLPASGQILVNGHVVSARDGVGLSGGKTYAIEATEGAELVVVETVAN